MRVRGVDGSETSGDGGRRVDAAWRSLVLARSGEKRAGVRSWTGEWTGDGLRSWLVARRTRSLQLELRPTRPSQPQSFYPISQLSHPAHAPLPHSHSHTSSSPLLVSPATHVRHIRYPPHLRPRTHPHRHTHMPTPPHTPRRAPHTPHITKTRSFRHNRAPHATASLARTRHAHAATPTHAPTPLRHTHPPPPHTRLPPPRPPHSHSKHPASTLTPTPTRTPPAPAHTQNTPPRHHQRTHTRTQPAAHGHTPPPTPALPVRPPHPRISAIGTRPNTDRKSVV